MCADNVSKGGRAPSSLNLPVANAGGVIKPTHINSLAAALEKFAIQPSHGVRLTRTPSGSTLRVDEKYRHFHPWFAYVRSGWIHIMMGRFFYNSGSAGGGSKGGRNGWMSNKSYAHASGYVYTTDNGVTDGEFAAGAEVFCDIDDSNYISTRGMKNGKVPLITKKGPGLYYIEVSEWSGRQLTPANATHLTTAEGIEINKYSLNKKGSRVPIIKWASLEDARYITNLIYPICTVDKYNNIFQGVRSDIYHIVAEDECPFTCTFASPQAGNPTPGGETKRYVAVQVGVINKVIPKINNKYIDEPEVYLDVSNAPGFVYAKATYEPSANSSSNKYFPAKVEIAFVSGDALDADTDTVGHFPIARIRRTELDPGGPGDIPATYADDYTIAQIVCGNLIVNRLKAGANSAIWWWDIL